MSQLLIIFLCAVLPAVLFPSLFLLARRSTDAASYAQLKRYTVIVTLWGAFGASTIAWIAVRLVHSISSNIAGEEIALGFTVLAIAPIVEEILKALPALFIYLLLPKEKHDIITGFFLGCFAGFGFAMAENFTAWFTYSQTASTAELYHNVLMRLIITTSMHAIIPAMIYASILSGIRIWSLIPTALFVTSLGIIYHACVNIYGLKSAESVSGILVITGIATWTFITAASCYAFFRTEAPSLNQ